jgi:hypothetical protein
MGGRRLTVGLAMLVTTLAAALLLYVASYFAIVRHGMRWSGEGQTCYGEAYLLFDAQARSVYSPIHRIDRKWLRPTHWQFEDTEPLGLGISRD